LSSLAFENPREREREREREEDLHVLSREGNLLL
jgi:hypothetical protein